MRRAWTEGAALVAGRGLTENLTSRTFKLVTGSLLLLSIAAAVLPQLLRGGETTYTLATVGAVPADVRAGLDEAARSGGFRVEYISREGAESLRQAIQDGDATAGLVDDTLYVSTDADGTFPVVVSQTVVTIETLERLDEAGLTEEEISELQSIAPPEQVEVGKADDAGRAVVGFAVGIVLYLALVLGGSAIATTVGLEKSTRISEVLLAVLRPSQILVGTVLAVGAATLVQLLALAGPLAVAVQVTDDIGLPRVAALDLGLAVAWFLLGFALYAFVFAATASLVDKITEVASAIMPVTTTLLVAYLLGVVVVTEDPGSIWSVALSIFPLTAPLAMPVRWASGDVPVYELVLAMLLTAATSVAFVAIASSIYRRALVITGRRVGLREVLRGRPAGGRAG